MCCKALKILWAIVGVVLAAIALGWWAAKSIPFHPPQGRSRPERLVSSGNSTRPLSQSAAEAGQVAPMIGLEADSPTTDLSTNWETKVEAILNAPDEDDAVKANRLLSLLAELPLEGQLETAQRLNEVLPDEQYPGLASYLVDPESPEPLQEVLLEGLIGRSDVIRLPLLLSIAQDEEHPHREDALAYLESLLGVNSVTNWAQLSSLVATRVQSSPQEVQAPAGDGTMATQDPGTANGL